MAHRDNPVVTPVLGPEDIKRMRTVADKIYLDSKAQMVVVKQSSDPEPESDTNETDSPLIYQALAEYLMKH